MSWWNPGKFTRSARLPSRDLAREIVRGDVVQGEGFRAQAGSRLRPGALDAGAKAVAGAPERCRQVGPDWNLGPRRQPRGDRPCHDADTPGGQGCAAGMAGRSGGSRAMGNHAIAMRISAESAGGQRSGHRWEPAAQRRPERRGINLSHPLQPIREASRSSAGLPTHRALTSGHGHNRQPHAPSTSPGTGNAGQRPRRATQSRSAAATCASIPRTMARVSRYACHIFSLPGRGRLLLG